MRWQVQEAKQRFSEVLRAAQTEPQIVTRHGEEIAVIVDIEHYHQLRGQRASLLAYLREEPYLDDELVIERPGDGPRDVDLAG